MTEGLLLASMYPVSGGGEGNSDTVPVKVSTRLRGDFHNICSCRMCLLASPCRRVTHMCVNFIIKRPFYSKMEIRQVQLIEIEKGAGGTFAEHCVPRKFVATFSPISTVSPLSYLVTAIVRVAAHGVVGAVLRPVLVHHRQAAGARPAHPVHVVLPANQWVITG